MKKISNCIGTYEKGNTVCDGDKESLDKKKYRGCAWKKRCKNFTCFLKKTKKDSEEYFEFNHEKKFATPRNGVEKFADFCDRLADSEILNSSVDRRRLGPSQEALKNAAAAKKRIANEKRAELSDWLDVFLKILEKNLKEIKFAKSGQLIRLGQLYVVDKLKLCDYLTVTINTKESYGWPMLRVKQRTSDMSYDVWLPLEQETVEENLLKKDASKFDVLPLKKGRFRSKVHVSGKKEMLMLAENIAHIANKGFLAPRRNG